MSISIPESTVPAGTVVRAGEWTVAHRSDGSVRAVSSRCRHQLADLSKGSLDKDGCLVCPWHGSRYDLDTGAMVQGPHGFLWYVGQTPGYSQMIRAYGAVLRLRTRAVERRNGSLVVADK
jgi:nitrite reductase/ring-hydroxylating ferredoxin subunit